MCSGVLTLPVNTNYIIHVFACLIKYRFFSGFEIKIAQLTLTTILIRMLFSFLWESVEAYDMLRLAVLLHTEP